MALVKLGDKAVGSTVKLKVNGAVKEFLVVHQGLPGSMYDTSCDGTWLLMKDIYENRNWHNSKVNDYANSTIHSYLNSTFLDLFDADIKAAIRQIKLPYRAGSGYGKTVTSGASGLSAKIFLLSSTEVNLVHGDEPTNEGACLSYFAGTVQNGADNKRSAKLAGSAANWWLRSPMASGTYGSEQALLVGNNGRWYSYYCNYAWGIRPALILPATLCIGDDGAVVTNTAPTVPSSITVPAQINGGNTVTISWGTSTDAEDNLEGYKAERSLDGGTTWSQIYQGSAVSATNTVPFGSESVMYRVKAYDAEGLESGWKTSAQATVINNTAPTVPGSITVPEAVQGGQPLAVSWGASSDGENNLAGYSLERQVDGGEWAAAYSGPELSFTDAITKGWQTVAYRVRAYDTANAYSGFAASETRQVNNNTPPVISCEIAANTNLGVKAEGFAISYSVADEEGDAVAVTEAVDGTALRTFTATLGGSNSFQLTGVDFMKLLNGRHTLAVTADDGASSAAHSLSFTKEVTAASVTLAQPMEADGPISVCVLAVSGFIPADADYQVEVTGNALDGEPVWEDCTAAVRAGANHVFAHKTAAPCPAFNFRLNVSRGSSGVGGYITSVQGGFQ